MSPKKTDIRPDIWTQAQEHLRKILDDHDYKNWFAQTSFVSFDDGHLVVAVPSGFLADWLRDHYMDAIHESVRRSAPSCCDVSFHVSAGADPALLKATQHSEPVQEQATLSLNDFNPRYTFGGFVIGSGNRFANAAARAVADSPGRAYNPLFLYGDTGLGKTHLMQAVGQHLLAANEDLKVVFISSDEFTSQLIHSIASKSTSQFHEKYRNVDVLLIDDIHFIAGKEATQEEFFHTFNALFDRRKQIVLSSDRCPKELSGVEARLVSRFECGLVTDIQPPDLETRVAILQCMVKQEKSTVPQEVMRYIATYVTTNIRELQGAMITVLAYGRLTEQEVALQMVEEVLRDLIGSEKIKPITTEQIQRAVAEHFDVRIADLRGRSRLRQVVVPRQLAIYLCKTLIPSLSLSDVGEKFGGKDHTTVLYACDKVGKEARTNTELRRTLEVLTRRIQG